MDPLYTYQAALGDIRINRCFGLNCEALPGMRSRQNQRICGKHMLKDNQTRIKPLTWAIPSQGNSLHQSGRRLIGGTKIVKVGQR